MLSLAINGVNHIEGLTPNAVPCWVTQAEGRSHVTLAAIEADWAAGRSFRIYRHAVMVTREHTDRMLKSGFTHLRVVYQRGDLSVCACDIDLSKHKEAM